MSERLYLALTTGSMFAGLAVIMAVPSLFARIDIDIPMPLLLVAGLGSFIAGFEISSRTDEWASSLVGYIVANLGLGLACASLFQTMAIPALGVTLLGVLQITIVAAVRPSLVRGWGSFAIASLLSILVLQAVPQMLAMEWLTLDWRAHMLGLVVLAYLDYYLTRALELARTVTNAVDTACAVYVDVLNQILRVANR